MPGQRWSVMKRKCRKCGAWIRLVPVATNADTGEDLLDWCAPSSPMAVCPVADLVTGSRHRPEFLY